MEKKSPLKAKPLRLPGQSVQDDIDKLLDDHLMPNVMVTMFLVVLSFYNWWVFISKKIPNPIITTTIAIMGLGYTTWKVIRGRRKLNLLRMGRDGERAVAQFLDRLRVEGYHLLHDIVGEGFNIDHVAIGPSGVYTIETKTISKPANGEPKIQYNGEFLLLNGFKPDRNPIIQAKAQCSWLKNLLKDSTGKQPPVQPVVVYPGWFIEGPKGMRPDVWVLNPKALPAFLENAPKRISLEDQKLYNFHLSRFIRTT